MLIKSDFGFMIGRCRTVYVWKRKPAGGAIVNIIAALFFFGLIALGVLWVLKTAGDMGQQYGEAVVTTKLKATTVTCQTNLRAIWQNLQMYSIDNEKLPESFEVLSNWSGNSRMFRCPDPNGLQYVYIPGQNMDSPPQNILLYEPQAVHNGASNVLRVNGQIELLNPQDLKAAVEQTRMKLR